MKRLNFKCFLLTDIVISAQTATEGEHQSLNFIPGSNFLGILASAIYKQSTKLNYDIFHSGKIRFGDAHVVYKNSCSFQVPFSWFFPKGGKITESKTYMIDFINRKTNKELMDEGTVLKQVRDGYFTKDGWFLSFEKIYAQKTGYDPVNRRPLEGAMFGYEALQEGSEWQFCIDIDDELLIENNDIINILIQNLKGEKLLGRSKTAEFGSALIDYISTEDDIKAKDITPKEIELETSINQEKSKHNLLFLYAESRLAFRDKETGQSTFTPNSKDLGLPEEAKILWDHSQIRTGVYAPWNWKRDSRDEDRVFIEKGSVFTVDVSDINDKLTTEKIINGVGYYRTEGFGNLLVNPDFLNFEPKTGKLLLSLKSPANNPKNEEKEIIQPTSDLIKWLNQRNSLDKVMDQTSFDDIMKEVEHFIHTYENKFTKVTNNQWGNIRSRANVARNKKELLDLLFEKPDKEKEIIGGDLYHGIAAEQWGEGRNILEDEINKMKMADEKILQFVEKLAARMQKEGGAK